MGSSSNQIYSIPTTLIQRGKSPEGSASAKSATLKTAKEATNDVPNQSLVYFDFIVSLSQISGIGMLGLAAYVFGTNKGGLQWNRSNAYDAHSNAGNLNFHGLLMTTGLVFLQGEALLAFRLYRHEAKSVVAFLHMLFYVLSMGFGVGGIWAILMQKNLVSDQGTHFASSHAWIGLIVLVGHVLHTMIGTLLYVFPGASADLKKMIEPGQRAFGITLFLANVGQLLTGILQYANAGFDDDCPKTMSCPKRMDLLLNVSAVFTVAYAICVIFLLKQQKWRPDQPEAEKKKEDKTI